MTRRQRDFYETLPHEIEELLKDVPLTGVVLEPTAGDFAISGPLARTGLEVLTNDIHGDHDFNFDLSAGDFSVFPPVSWVVMNPPFKHAVPIVQGAYNHASVGVAAYLRLTYIEPCLNRRPFLVAHPPTRILVLPRKSYTGDGKSDSVTRAWFVWDKSGTVVSGVRCCG